LTIELLLGRHPSSTREQRDFRLAAGGDGIVYTASPRRIWAIDTRTARIELFAPEFDEISGLAVDGRGGLLISEQPRDRVCRLDLATRAIDRSVEVRVPGAIACVGERAFVASHRTIVEIDRAFTTATHYAGGGVGIVDGPVTSAGFREVHSLVDHRGALYVSDHNSLRRIDLATDTVSSVGHGLSEQHSLVSCGTYLFGCRVGLERLEPNGAVTTLGTESVRAIAGTNGELFSASSSQLSRVDPETGVATEIGLLADYADNYGACGAMVALHGSQLALLTTASPTLAIVDLATGKHDAVRIARARHATALAFDGGDRLYACDWTAGVLCIAFGARTVAAIPGITGADRPDAIAVGAPDQLLVSLWTKRQLVALDLSTGVQTVLAELPFPVKLAYDGRGALYLGGASLEKLELSTNRRSVVAEGHCDALAIAQNGDVYVARGSQILRGGVTPVVGRSETTELELGTLPGSIGRVRAMCALDDDSLGIVDYDHDVVLRVRLRQ
jgi:hypothetical protein